MILWHIADTCTKRSVHICDYSFFTGAFSCVGSTVELHRIMKNYGSLWTWLFRFKKIQFQQQVCGLSRTAPMFSKGSHIIRTLVLFDLVTGCSRFLLLFSFDAVRLRNFAWWSVPGVVPYITEYLESRSTQRNSKELYSNLCLALSLQTTQEQQFTAAFGSQTKQCKATVLTTNCPLLSISKKSV